MRERVDILLTDISSLLTLDSGEIPRRGVAAGDIGRIEDGAIAIRNDRIIAVGASSEIAGRYEAPDTGHRSLAGCTVLPGFIDAHTHVLFAGSREAEFEMRLQGRTYMEIAAAGGGINASVRAFRRAPDEQLIAETRKRLDAMLVRGTTTVEAKSGYGLSVEHEVRALRLIDQLDVEHPDRSRGDVPGRPRRADGVSRAPERIREPDHRGDDPARGGRDAGAFLRCIL